MLINSETVLRREVFEEVGDAACTAGVVEVGVTGFGCMLGLRVGLFACNHVLTPSFAVGLAGVVEVGVATLLTLTLGVAPGGGAGRRPWRQCRCP